METYRLKQNLFLVSIALLMSFSACNILGSSDSGELEIIVEGQVFEADDSVTIQISNNYSHDIFMHNQSFWNLQQYVDDEWKTIYAPIADTGPPRFSQFIETGELKVLKLPALPSYALYKSGHNEFRFTFGLFHNPNISSPLPESQRISSSFIISFE